MTDPRQIRSDGDRARRIAGLAPSRRKQALEDNAYYAEYDPSRQSMWYAAAKLTDPTEFLLAYADEMDRRAQSIEDYRAKRDKEMARMTIASRERYRQILSHDADIDHACGPDCAGNPDYQYERQVGK